MILVSSGRIAKPIVVIPAYNEQGSVGRVVSDVKQSCPYPVVVVDDASIDLTRKEAEEAGALVIPLTVNLGAWGATQTGIRYALRHSYNVVVTLDADGQHNPEDISTLIGPIIDGSADVAIGAFTDRGSRARRLAWRMMKAVSGIGIDDLTSGFRSYSMGAMRELASWRATYLEFQDVGVLAILIQAGLTIEEVAVDMSERRVGHSRIFNSWAMVGYYMAHTLLLGFTKRKSTVNYGNTLTRLRSESGDEKR